MRRYQFGRVVRWTFVLACGFLAEGSGLLGQDDSPEPPPWLNQDQGPEIIPSAEPQLPVPPLLEPSKIGPAENPALDSADCDPTAPYQHGNVDSTEEWQSQLFDHRSLLFKYGNRDPNGPLRHVGLGQPLVGTSWLNRPYHFDAFVGGLFGDELNRSGLRQRGALISGVRLGWDADHYWGIEARFAAADPTLSNGSGGDIQFFDLHATYFPWGDARWRPYVGLGSGIARYTFFDDVGQPIAETSYHLPVSAGIKFMFQKWLSLRVDVSNNIAFGNTLRAVNNVSLTSGLEWHFGGKRRSYYPFESRIRAR